MDSAGGSEDGGSPRDGVFPRRRRLPQTPNLLRCPSRAQSETSENLLKLENNKVLDELSDNISPMTSRRKLPFEPSHSRLILGPGSPHRRRAEFASSRGSLSSGNLLSGILSPRVSRSRHQSDGLRSSAILAGTQPGPERKSSSSSRSLVSPSPSRERKSGNFVAAFLPWKRGDRGSRDRRSNTSSFVSENSSDRDDEDSRSSSVQKIPELVLRQGLKLNQPVSTQGLTVQPFFFPSRFSSIPPTIRFYLPGEKVERPRKSVCKMLKWCHNSLVPKVVRKCIHASHFQIVHEQLFWLGYWGKHLKTTAYRQVHPYQKVNHFPGAFHMGRKDRLWTNINRMAIKWGSDHFHIMPRTYVLPKDAKRLKARLKESISEKIILKPPASARGSGIKIVHKWSQVPKKQSLIAQVYLERPYLINGSKFDLRLYVYITSFNPLRVYLYEDGLVRFASVKYSRALSSLSNQFIHLTNYSINKDATGEEENCSTTGTKWSLRRLWKFLAGQGHDIRKIMEDIVDLTLKAIISCESSIFMFVHQNTDFPFVCHELFGFDIILDEDLKPWLLEINISPSLHSQTDLDVSVKAPLARDVLNLSGMHVPDKTLLGREHVSAGTSPRGDRLDYRLKNMDSYLDEEEKQKQATVLEEYLENGGVATDSWGELTGAELRVLLETEDEFERRGQFTRLFPSPFSSRYLQFMDRPRFYNLLLDYWTTQHFHNREAGLALLEQLCQDGRHLYTPSTN